MDTKKQKSLIREIKLKRKIVGDAPIEQPKITINVM